jgi:hypothetical protein
MSFGKAIYFVIISVFISQGWLIRQGKIQPRLQRPVIVGKTTTIQLIRSLIRIFRKEDLVSFA